MNRVKYLNVFYYGRKVGKIALYKERFAAFEYDRQWLANGFSISPFSLPLEQKVFLPRIDLDKIAEECTKILKSSESDNLDELFRLGGSSGGARPKILAEINGEEWIIKFPSSEDRADIGKQEYISQCDS